MEKQDIPMRVPMPSPGPSSRPYEEHHYTVAELAVLWHLSEDTIRKLFRNEPGVMVLGNQSARRKRGYTTLRIPASIAHRVHQQCSLVKYD